MRLFWFLRRKRTVAGVRVAKADVRPDLPSHVKGVHQGNSRGREPGVHFRRKGGARGTARRSTGIRPLRHNAILPGIMPNLSPP